MGTGSTPSDPATVGPYRLVRRLGSGGMGVVHLARDPAGRLVALKVVRPELARDPAYLRRFAAEAAAARRVAGFCTARVLDVEVTGPAPYIVTEHVDGPSLEAVLAARSLSTSEVEALAVGVAAALTAIHAAGVVHRDVKPANVLMSPFGPKVIDFGIARTDADPALTSMGLVLGSPGWMAPERARGDTGTAGDVYAWGLLVARAGTPWRPADHAFSTPPTAADLGVLPAQLAALVRAALHPEPGRRPTAQALLLRLCGSAEPGPVRAATKVLTRTYRPGTTARPPTGPAAAPSSGHAAAPPPGSHAAPPPGSHVAPLPGSHAAPVPGSHAAPPAGPPPGSHGPPPRWSQQPPPSGHGAHPYRPPPPRAAPPPVRRRRRWWWRKRVLLPAALVAGLVLLPDSRPPDEATLPPLTARDGMLEFHVLATTCGLRTVGEGPTARQAQGQLCTVDVQVRNIGDEARRVEVAKQSLLDESGRRFSADTGAWLYLPGSRPFFGEEINPGNEVTATLVYDIAADAVPARLQVHDSWLSGGASIDL